MSKYITVFCPTYNGEKYIAELIEAVLNQEMPEGYRLEFIIIDSGSTDNTVNIIKEHYLDKLTFIQIPNSDFGHGKTRQKAAEMARGEFILYLSQDATPTSRRWAKDMIEPFYVSDKVGCVFGRQIPRPDAVPTIKREVSTVFGQFGAPDSITLHRHRSLVDGENVNSLNTFFSDVNSAIRKDLNAKIPYRDLKYAEDQALAEDMQNSGYLKAYAVRGSVWHSNEYSIQEFEKRKFDEYIGLIDSVNYKLKPSLKSLLLGWIKPTLDDLKFIKRDGEYSKKLKLKYAMLSIGYNIAGSKGKYKAAKYQSDEAKKKSLSLEESRKNTGNTT